MITRGSRALAHPLHSMCSYLGSFPPHVPRSLLAGLEHGSVVLDPFCGSGTTLLEASVCGFESVGIDLNPLAISISRAKAQPVTLGDVLHRIRILAANYEEGSDDVPEEVRLIFHDRTLQQLCYLRDTLVESQPEDVFLRGAILGILHGKARKDGSSAYLSIDMPNTFSMSPRYVEGFVFKHGLRKRPADVFTRLRERAERLLRSGSPANSAAIHVVQADATQLRTAVDHSGCSRVDAIISSPPYLGVLRYGAFNWIRLWFLGESAPAVDSRLDSTDSLDRYLSFFATFLLSAQDILPRGAPVTLVIGDVVERGSHLRLAERAWEEVSGLVDFSLHKIVEDAFNEDSKTTRIWGDEKKGRATPVDRILCLRRK
jgi:hypothetical protein